MIEAERDRRPGRGATARWSQKRDGVGGDREMESEARWSQEVIILHNGEWGPR